MSSDSVEFRARPACVRCGQQFKRLRKTAIYCSSSCREKVNGLRASKKRTAPRPYTCSAAHPGNLS
jgi:hypothetical protein